MTAAAPQNGGGNMGTEFTEVEYRSHIPEVMGSNPIGSCQPSCVINSYSGPTENQELTLVVSRDCARTGTGLSGR